MALRSTLLARVVVALGAAAVLAWIALAQPAQPSRSPPVLAPGSVERFAPLLGDGPDARWDGCWLVGASNDRTRLLLTLRCASPASESITIAITGASEGYDIDVQGAGSASPGLRAATSQQLHALFPQSPFGAVESTSVSPTYGAPLVLVLLVAFLLAWAFGVFGWIAVTARDRVVLVPLVVALVVRTGLTLHTSEEIRLHFQTGILSDVLMDKHSYVAPLLQFLSIALFGRPVVGHFAFNVLVSTMTTLPLYVFVSRRTEGDRRAALLASLLFAIQPALARSGASDAHYPLLIAAWCCGLAMLSDPALEARAVFGGLVWLGIAASCRFEGVLYVVASAPLLGRDALGRIARHRIALVSGALVIGALLITEYVLKYHLWRGDVGDVARSMPRPLAALELALFGDLAGGPSLGGLTLVAIAVGLASPKRRLMLALIAAWMFVVVVTLGATPALTPIFAHRVSPQALLQTIVAGVGLAAGIERLRPAIRDPLTAITATLVALVVLVTTVSVRTDEHAFNVEFRLAWRAATETNVDSALAFFGCDHDGSLCNPERVAPHRAILDCRHDDCGGAQLYLRTGACFGSDGDTISEMCRAFESRVALTPIEEVESDLAEAYGDASLPRHARLGLYRVTVPPR